MSIYWHRSRIIDGVSLIRELVEGEVGLPTILESTDDGFASFNLERRRIELNQHGLLSVFYSHEQVARLDEFTLPRLEQLVVPDNLEMLTLWLGLILKDQELPEPLDSRARLENLYRMVVESTSDYSLRFIYPQIHSNGNHLLYRYAHNSCRISIPLHVSGRESEISFLMRAFCSTCSDIGYKEVS